MKNAQATTELLMGYAIAFIIISVVLAVVFTFVPSLFATSSTNSYSGFAGLRVLQQGYTGSVYYINFQNLLNENINISGINLLTGNTNKTGFFCTSSYLTTLAITTCSANVSLTSPWSASVDIYYTPSNTSTHPKIQISGSVSGVTGSTPTTTFTESGLVAGSTWNVTYNGITKSSNTNTIAIATLFSGSFSYKTYAIPISSSATYCYVKSYYIPSVYLGSLAAGSSVAISFANSTGCTLAYVSDADQTPGIQASIINTTSNTDKANLTTLTTGANESTSIAMTPNGKAAYFLDINVAPGFLSVLNTSSNAIITNIPTAQGLVSAEITPNGKLAYLSTYFSHKIIIVNITNNKENVANITVGGSPYGFAITPNGKFAYVADVGEGVTVLNLTSNTVLVPGIPVGTNPANVAITLNGQFAYVTNYGSNTVSVINITSNKDNIANISVSDGPDGIVIMPSGKLAYVTMNTGHGVSVINLTSDTVLLANISVGSYPNGLAISANGKFVYVANQESASVSVINTSSNAVIRTIPVGIYPDSISLSDFTTGSNTVP